MAPLWRLESDAGRKLFDARWETVLFAAFGDSS
jgi:hypothetical protein